MRTLGFRTHVVLVLSGALALLAGLGMPWYGRAPRSRPDAAAAIGDVGGPLEAAAAGLSRWLAAGDGVTAWEALGQWANGLAGLAAVAALSALACLTAATQPLAREALRYAALATLPVVGWWLVQPPGERWELRHGALLAAGAVLVLVAGALPVAGAPRLRRRAPAAYRPPPTPLPYEPPADRSVPPPGGG